MGDPFVLLLLFDEQQQQNDDDDDGKKIEERGPSLFCVGGDGAVLGTT